MGSLLSKWLADVFSHPDVLGALVIAGKTAIIYVLLIIGLRLLGKRELGQMSIYDLVLIVVIANAVQNAMVGSDNTLVGGLVAALTLLLLNRGFTILLMRSDRIEQLMLGEPVLVVKDGKLLRERMRKEGLTAEHVLAAMREHGIGDLAQVQMAVLEVDGTISIIPKDLKVFRTRRRFRGLHTS